MHALTQRSACVVFKREVRLSVRGETLMTEMMLVVFSSSLAANTSTNSDRLDAHRSEVKRNANTRVK